MVEFTNKKPNCALIGQDGNIFNLMGIASRTLKQHGMVVEAKEMSNKIYACGSYSEALSIIGEYVNITSEDSKDKCYGHDSDYDCEDAEDMGIGMGMEI